MDEELRAYLEAMEGRLMSKMSLLVEGLHTAINGIRLDDLDRRLSRKPEGE